LPAGAGRVCQATSIHADFRRTVCEFRQRFRQSVNGPRNIVPRRSRQASTPAGPLLFATRWITHFCAPVFVLPAGTTVGLMAQRRPPRELGAFLLARGLWLVAIEWFVISTAWTFAPLGLAQFQGMILVPLQVVWAIGASMVVLAAAQFLGGRACLVIGAAIVLGHNPLDGIWPVSHRGDIQRCGLRCTRR